MNLKTTVGIYQILNKVTFKCYVGSTKRSFHDRFKDHKRFLKQDKHPNKHLQSAWNKYGEESFEFEILEVIDKSLDKLYFLEQEQYWIVKFNSFNREFGYNRVANPSANIKFKSKIKLFNKVLKDKTKKIRFKKLRCIKGWCPVNYYYAENVVTKEQTLISNIIKFAREHNLNPSNLRSTLNSTRYQCNNYRLISLDEHKNNHKQPKWLVITPEAKDLLVHDLKDYCKRNKLQYESLKQTSHNPKSFQHKGYRCYYLDNVLNNTQQYPKCDFTYKVIEPNGKLHITNSLTRLGNNLEAIDGKTLAHISCGRAIKYVELGWKVISL